MGRIFFTQQEGDAYILGSHQSAWKDLILNDFRAIPFAVVYVSLGWQIILIFASTLRAFTRHETQHEEDGESENPRFSEKLREHVAYFGGYIIVGFMSARLIGSAFLLFLSRKTLQNTCGSFAFRTCPEALLTSTFTYSTIMGTVSLISKVWSKSATRFNIVVLMSTLLVYLYRDVWPLATYTEQPADAEEGHVLWVKIGILFTTAAFIPLFIPRRYVPVDHENPMPNPNPEQTGSIFSIATYAYLNGVISMGNKVSHLSLDMLPPLADYNGAKYQTEKSFPHLDVYSGAPQRHLFFRFLRVYWQEYLVLVVSLLIYSLAGFVAPIGIYKILKYLETDGADEEVRPWVWIAWLFLGPMTRSICWQFYIFISTRVLALTEMLVTQLVFEHSLRVRFKAETSNTSESEPLTATPSSNEIHVGCTEESSDYTVDVDNEEGSTESPRKDQEVNQEPAKPLPKDDDDDKNLIGKINNLVTTDLENIVSSRNFLFLIIGAPLNIGLCLLFLYRLLGWSTFVGFGTMIALFPVPGLVANKIQQASRAKMKVTDARIQAVSETLNVIRMVKLFGWENRMAERLKGKRDEELKFVWKIKLLNCISSMIGFILPTITMVATYGVYTIIMKQEITPSIVFSSIAVFNTLRGQLFEIMDETGTLLQGKVSLDRLNDFLQHTELLDSYTKDNDTSTSILSVPTLGDELSYAIGFKNASFSWSASEGDGALVTPSRRAFKLRIEGDLLFKRNSINMIIGPTGSGKTSMLMALLGEMHFIPFAPDSWYNLPRQGGVAYASQESWVLNDTIRHNILFGSEYDEERYNTVIKQCALQQDLDMFDAGDATEVGERGLTLSGGQKARVTLARAIYSRAGIILLDDVLAALDVHTATWIVDSCLRGDLVRGRTILIVTHNVALVTPVADFIVSIGTNGKITSQGNQVAVAASRDPQLAAELKADAEATAKLSEGKIDAVSPEKVAPSDGKLTVAEEIAEGHVTWKSFKLLLKGLGGDYPIVFFTIVIVALLLNEATYNFQTWYIGYWGSQYESRPASEVPVYLYLSGYSGITLLFCLTYLASYMLSMWGSIRASRIINSRLIDSILGSTLRWLDQTPVGRITARCTQDIRSIDGPVPQTLLWVVDCVVGVVIKLGVIMLFSPIFVWPGLGVTLAGVWLGNMYLKTQLSVTRETSNAQAPVLSHFSASVHGLTSIRAYGAQGRFKDESLVRINHYTRVARMSYNLNRWIGIRMDFLGASFTAALATYLVYGPRVGANNTGFSLNVALDFTGLILAFVRIYNDFEVQSNSLERIQGYLDIEHEPRPTEEGKPPAAWPTSGDLRVENLSARYSKDGPQILHDLSFHVASGERVGIVGRTGSGKSSLTLALLRCILTEGEVYLDGVPTSGVNLDALRTSITIIPQVPELLSGTLRENLDPFDQNDDAVLNSALDAAGLFSLQEDAGEASLTLDTKIANGGGNLSVGQRQIIALARAMVRGSKLLMLDEATSAIDYKTDAVIQSTLRTQLPRDVTVVTIAHRLQTIMDSDKIMVLDNGRIAEFGTPTDLLQKEDGMLRALVNESSDKEKLHELASEQCTGCIVR